MYFKFVSYTLLSYVTMKSQSVMQHFYDIDLENHFKGYGPIIKDPIAWVFLVQK